MYPYIVIDRPGFYGREGRVWSCHRTLEAARRAAAKHTYTDERGRLRSITIVASNTDGNRYRQGDMFWADMAPQEV